MVKAQSTTVSYEVIIQRWVIILSVGGLEI